MKKNIKKIRFSDYPPEHAQKAYNKGYYIEAIQVIHSWIEAKLQEMLLLIRHGNLKINYNETWNISNSVPLLQLAKVLFILGKINKKTFDSIKRFNTMRNKIIHELFYDDYNNGLREIDKKDYDSAFNFGTKLCYKMEIILGKLATRGQVGKKND